MNDLGLTLAWLAVQVALVLAPALALYALASRRGAVAGSWVASMSLGLVVILNAAAFLPGIGLGLGLVRWTASDRNAGTLHPAAATTPAVRPYRSRGDAPRRTSRAGAGRCRAGGSPGTGSGAGRPSRRPGSGRGVACCRPSRSPAPARDCSG